MGDKGRAKANKQRGPAISPGLRPSPTKSIPKKQTTVVEDEGRDQTIIIRFDQLDIGGPFCLSTATTDELKMIFGAIPNLETMRVHDVFSGNPGKRYVAADLPNPEAIARLEELDLDDQDSIWRIRLGNKPRLYGFLRGRFFHVLWWDPGHLIWPLSKD